MPCKHALEVTIDQLKWIAAWDRVSDNGHPLIEVSREARKVLNSIPKTIQIGIHAVPEPMREKPGYNIKYWVPSILNEDMADWFLWLDNDFGNRLFDKGLCHSTKEAAIAHAKALFSFSEIKG